MKSNTLRSIVRPAIILVLALLLFTMGCAGHENDRKAQNRLENAALKLQGVEHQIAQEKKKLDTELNYPCTNAAECAKRNRERNATIKTINELNKERRKLDRIITDIHNGNEGGGDDGGGSSGGCSS